MSPRANRVATRALTPDELGAWLRFLKKADRCARDPVGQAEIFQGVAERVGKRLRLPPGQHSAGADLVTLIRLGREFLKRDALARAAAGPEIAQLAASARRIVTAAMEAAEAPARRERKDIDG